MSVINTPTEPSYTIPLLHKSGILALLNRQAIELVREQAKEMTEHEVKTKN